MLNWQFLSYFCHSILTLSFSLEFSLWRTEQRKWTVIRMDVISHLIGHFSHFNTGHFGWKCRLFWPTKVHAKIMPILSVILCDQTTCTVQFISVGPSTFCHRAYLLTVHFQLIFIKKLKYVFTFWQVIITCLIRFTG